MNTTETIEFQHAGMQCSVRPAPLFGALNGYVGVDKEHPYYCKGYGEDVPDLGSAEASLNVHGGVTFAGTFKESDLWWIGFDTLHAMDFSYVSDSLEGVVWLRDKEYVIAETKRLAEQLAAMK